MKQQNGFTLIELMITVVIAAILAGIAYPSYQNSVMTSRRADAKGALLGLANAMERHFTETNSYLGAGSEGDTGSPIIFSAISPVGGGIAYYNLTITEATDSSYILNAAPTGVQADDKCGTLSLNQAGVRGISADLYVDECW